MRGSGKRAGKGAAGVMALVLLSLLAGGSRASESAPAAVTEAQLFTREFREKGALRFYEATEEELRLGRFEAAFLRYRFLKGRVAGDPAYRPLTAMVDHRLRFLSGQMGLAGVEVPALRATRPRPAPAAPAAPRAIQDPPPGTTGQPEKAQAPQAAAPESAASPLPAPAADPPPAASGPLAADAPPSPAPEQQKAQEMELAEQKPAPEAPAPPPPPSRWQRLKARLFFWRK